MEREIRERERGREKEKYKERVRQREKEKEKIVCVCERERERGGEGEADEVISLILLQRQARRVSQAIAISEDKTLLTTALLDDFRMQHIVSETPRTCI